MCSNTRGRHCRGEVYVLAEPKSLAARIVVIAEHSGRRFNRDFLKSCRIKYSTGNFGTGQATTDGHLRILRDIELNFGLRIGSQQQAWEDKQPENRIPNH